MQKNQTLFIILRYVNLKILQSDWLRRFWPISQKPDFSQVWDLCNNTVNSIYFLYRPKSEKKQWKIFPINSKTLFLTHLLHFGGKCFFSKIPAVTHNTKWASNAMRVSEQTNEPIPRKVSDRRTEGWKDRQTLFHRTLLATQSRVH